MSNKYSKIKLLAIFGLVIILVLILNEFRLNFSLFSQKEAQASAVYYTQLEQEISAKGLPVGDYIVGGAAEDSVLQSFTHYGLTTRPVIEDVTGQKFTKSIRLGTKQKPKFYNTSWRFNNPKPVNKGDVLLAVINIKLDNQSQGKVLMRYELKGSPYTDSFNREIFLDNNWKTLYFTFKAVQDYSPNKSLFLLHLGYQEQAVNVGGVALMNFGTKVSLSDLEVLKTKVTYAGRESNTSWRQAAQDRIERIRKADMRFQVVDSTDKPINCASVDVQMQKHKYGFGSVVSYPTFQSETDNQIYKKKVEELFSHVALMKYWFDEENTSRNILKTLAWLDEKGMTARRGHNLIWPAWQWMAKDMENHQSNSTYLKRRANEWIVDSLTKLKGRLLVWDVINEPYLSRDLINILGDDVMKDWLALAKKTDPKAKVFVNEIDVIETGVFPSPAYNNLVKLIQSWQSDNIPIEGVGVQGHFDEGNLTKPEILLKIFDGLAAYNLDIQITEYDFKTTDEQLKADYTRDIMTAAFSHPSTSAFVMWGFWDGAHWKEDAPLFYKDWTLKPAGKAWVDLVQNQWWTKEQGRVDDKGNYSTKGFLGFYKITVKAGDLSKTFDVFLDSTGIDSDLKLQAETEQVCK